MNIREELRKEVFINEYVYATQRMAILDSSRYTEKYLRGVMGVSTSLHQMSIHVASGFSVLVNDQEEVKKIFRAMFRIGRYVKILKKLEKDVHEAVEDLRPLLNNLIERNKKDYHLVSEEFNLQTNTTRSTKTLDIEMSNLFDNNKDDKIVHGKPMQNQTITGNKDYMDRLEPNNMKVMKKYYEDRINTKFFDLTQDGVKPIAGMTEVEEMVIHTDPITKEVDFDYDFLKPRKYLLKYLSNLQIGKIITEWEDKQNGYVAKVENCKYDSKEHTICYFNELIGYRPLDNPDLICKVVKHLNLSKEVIQDLIVPPEAHDKLEAFYE